MNKKWYYIVLYSFDPEHRVAGPFHDEKTCVDAMMAEAKQEHAIDIENGRDSYLYTHDDIGEAEILVYHDDDDDITEITEFIAFKINSDKGV